MYLMADGGTVLPHRGQYFACYSVPQWLARLPGLELLDNTVRHPHHFVANGSANVVRKADCVIEEFQAWESGTPLRYRVTSEVLSTMG